MSGSARRRSGAAIVLPAGVGLLISGYLTAIRLLGDRPACGPGGGCETVALSEYSEVLGIPVALYGLGFSLVLLLLGVAWWRTGDRRTVLAAYGLGLAGVLVIGYLTYLELFVIGAICAWCVAYALTVIAGFAAAIAITLRRTDEG